MRAGRLRHRITIEQSTETNSGGVPQVTWSRFAEAWAAVEPASAREQQSADQTQGLRTHAVLLRFVEGITSGMRVKFGERILNIEGVVNRDERNVQLELVCTEDV